jgi:hypothetical protein
MKENFKQTPPGKLQHSATLFKIERQQASTKGDGALFTEL